MPAKGAQEEAGQDAGDRRKRQDQPERGLGRDGARQQAVDVVADPQRQRPVHQQVHEPDAWPAKQALMHAP